MASKWAAGQPSRSACSENRGHSDLMVGRRNSPNMRLSLVASIRCFWLMPRKALQMSVDRETIAATYFKGYGDPTPYGLMIQSAGGWQNPRLALPASRPFRLAASPTTAPRGGARQSVAGAEPRRLRSPGSARAVRMPVWRWTEPAPPIATAVVKVTACAGSRTGRSAGAVSCFWVRKVGPPGVQAGDMK